MSVAGHPVSLPTRARARARARSSSAAIQRKLDNVGARSHLEEAIGSIRRANACWPFRYAAGLEESLRQLQAKIRREAVPAGVSPARKSEGAS